MGGERNHTPRTLHLWVAGAASLGLVGSGLGAWAAFGGDDAPRTGPLTASEVRSASHGFLDAWADGDTGAAAQRTDDTADAGAALRDYKEQAHLAPQTVRPGSPAGSRVPFSVRAAFAYDGARAPLAYDSALTVVRRPGDGRAVVHWEPQVLHP
ncbi:penicillin-binding protein, partial [Streptomyces sp. SID14478]|nr:penicillin-binding protein [Streptomyces sp. SID14478]